MDCISIDSTYSAQASALAQQACAKEQAQHDSLRTLDLRAEAADAMARLFAQGRGQLAVENGQLLGWLLPDGIGDGCVYCQPLGLGAFGERKGEIISRLFESCARQWARKGVHRYEIKCWAHDEAARWALAQEEFFVQCADCIRLWDRPSGRAYTGDALLRPMPLEEALARKEELLPLWRALVHHLQESPVFYYGEGFTDEAYLDLLSAPDTTLYVAEAKGQIVGIIDGNRDHSNVINGGQDCWNIGDVYVLPEYRKTGLAQALLTLACHDLHARVGANRLWVMHGTANPNARAFWDRQFDVYAYTLARELDARLIVKEEEP